MRERDRVVFTSLLGGWWHVHLFSQCACACEFLLPYDALLCVCGGGGDTQQSRRVDVRVFYPPPFLLRSYFIIFIAPAHHARRQHAASPLERWALRTANPKSHARTHARTHARSTRHIPTMRRHTKSNASSSSSSSKQKKKKKQSRKLQSGSSGGRSSSQHGSPRLQQVHHQDPVLARPSTHTQRIVHYNSHSHAYPAQAQPASYPSFDPRQHHQQHNMAAYVPAAAIYPPPVDAQPVVVAGRFVGRPACAFFGWLSLARALRSWVVFFVLLCASLSAGSSATPGGLTEVAWMKPLLCTRISSGMTILQKLSVPCLRRCGIPIPRTLCRQSMPWLVIRLACELTHHLLCGTNVFRVSPLRRHAVCRVVFET